MAMRDIGIEILKVIEGIIVELYKSLFIIKKLQNTPNHLL